MLLEENTGVFDNLGRESHDSMNPGNRDHWSYLKSPFAIIIINLYNMNNPLHFPLL